MSKISDEKIKKFWRLTIIVGSIINLIAGATFCAVQEKVFFILGVIFLVEAIIQLILLLVVKKFGIVLSVLLILFNLISAFLCMFDFFEDVEKEDARNKTNKEISELKEEVKKLNKQLEEKNKTGK